MSKIIGLVSHHHPQDVYHIQATIPRLWQTLIGLGSLNANVYEF